MMDRSIRQTRLRWLAICDGERPIWEEDFAQLRRLLNASADRSPQGQDREDGLGRNDESAVAKPDAQKSSSS